HHQAAEHARECANSDGCEHYVAARILHIFRKGCYGVEAEIGKSRERGCPSDVANVEGRRVVERLDGKQSSQTAASHEVVDGKPDEAEQDRKHERDQRLIGARSRANASQIQKSNAAGEHRRSYSEWQRGDRSRERQRSIYHTE